MTNKKRKKRVKMRGQKTHGHGSKKKRRGAGSRGGRGRAGIMGHRKLMFLKAGITVGRHGFVSLKKKRGIEIKSINLRDIEKLAGGKKKIDLTALGYEKVLGAGELKTPLVITAKSFSEKAKEKIEKAGGKAVTV